LVLIASLVILWQILFNVLGAHALTPPVETIAYLAQRLGDETFLRHIMVTSKAFVAALGVGAVIGLTVGFICGVHGLSGKVAEPVLISLYSTPKVILYPFILLAFGIGMSAKVAFGAIHGMFPIAIFTMNAIRGINPVYLDTASVLKLNRWTIVHSVLLPAAAPEIFTGLRIGFSVTLLGTLLAEMFGSRAGLGFLLMNAIGLHNVRVITAVTLLLVVFAVAVNSAMLTIERRLYNR
jgi:NitT/TauT family transport system permease protein